MYRSSLLLLAAALGLPAADDLAGKIETGLTPPYVVGSPVHWSLAERMAAHKTPAVSVAVIRGGKIVLAKGYGVREAGSAGAVDAATLFQAASISKPVAAMAALHMAQFGAYSLDEDVNGKLKSWKVPDNNLTAKEKVTLARLLSHTAGLTVHGFPGYAKGEPLPTVVQVLDGEKPANTPAVRVDVEPGSIWRYSGGGYTVAQQLMVDQLNKPFPEIMDMIVLKRIGMSRSTYAQPLPEALHANAARAHDDKGARIAGDWHTYPEMAAAGLWTTPSDLARFAIEVWKASRGESNRVLETATAKRMLTPVKNGYGLGLGISGEGNARTFGHGGSNEGFRCQMVMFLESGDGAVVMTNSERGDALVSEVLRSIASAEHWPALQAEKKTVVDMEAATLAEYAGRYRIGQAEVVFRVSGSHLTAELPDHRQADYFPESSERFFSQDGPPAVFHRSGDSVELEVFGRKAPRQRP